MKNNYKEITYYKLDEVMDIADITTTPAEEDFANLFSNLSALPGVYFYASDNPNFIREESIGVKMAFAAQLHASAKKYEPILNAFETEKANLLKGSTSTVETDADATPGVTTTSTNSGKDDVLVKNNGEDYRDMVQPSQTSTHTVTYDTPQTISATDNLDNRYASSVVDNTTKDDGTTHIIHDDRSSNTTTTHGLTNTVSQSGQDKSHSKTTTTLDEAVLDKLTKLVNATQNILQLWVNEFSAYFIYNVD